MLATNSKKACFSVLHEAGHALAAEVAGLPVLGAGVVIFLVFPAAFVELETAGLAALPPWTQLQVYSGGVWHNTALAGLAWAGLHVLPALLAPLYSRGRGLTVLEAGAGPVGGTAGLQPGDLITALQAPDFNTIKSTAKGTCITCY